MSAPNRRAVLKLIAAGMAASVAGCQRPDETIHPAVEQPEGTHPKSVRRYATALPLAGYMRGVAGLVVDGRPIKLEGLASHSASLGATDLFTEISILDLYDPQRLKAVVGPDGPSNWDAFARAAAERITPHRGEGAVLLTGRVTSPTLLARIAALQARWPGLRHVRWEPFDDDAVLAGTRAAFGRPLTPRPRLGDTDVLVCIGADPLGPGPEQVAHARAWADRRRRTPLPRTYVFESSPTATGVMADVRVTTHPSDLARLTRWLDGDLTGAPVELLPVLKSAIRDVARAKKRALVLAGERQPARCHAEAAALNARLGAPVDYIVPVDPYPVPHRAGMAALVRDMAAGRVDTLIVLDANPVYAVPGFAAAMAQVPLSVAATVFPSETSGAATWRLPLSHPLEAWSDGRAPDGTTSIAQPLVRPFYDTRSAVEVIDLLIDPASERTGYRRHREQWASLGEDGWRRALVTGIVPGTAARAEPVRRTAVPASALREARGERTWVVELRPSPTLFDGRFSTNAWAQECPDPLTKEVWGASARMHPAGMAALELAEGDLVRIEAGGVVTLQVHGLAAQARGVVTVLAGYGRSGTGAVADGLDANAFVLESGRPVRLSKAGGRVAVPTTQHAFALDGELAKLFPVVGAHDALPRRADRLPTLLPNPPARDHAPTQWAMAIDTDVCIGCNACVVACQAENNVPAIGPDEIAVGRDMHWLRVDRYDHARGGGFQPVPCMQCEAAPCEPVCPVEASVHDAQGLNLQVYNRCVGTRTCQANCPYKVRRFNFRDYAGASLWGDAEDASVSAQHNPDVTVRARGVMEKCTYCVQRIEAHNREADAGGTPAAVVTACQSACPTRAIAFGPIDGEAIRTARADPRHYALLEELGTKPRTTYLARRRNT